MAAEARSLEGEVRALRRYAFALLGSQERGDALVVETLRHWSARPATHPCLPHHELFRKLNELSAGAEPDAAGAGGGADPAVERADAASMPAAADAHPGCCCQGGVTPERPASRETEGQGGRKEQLRTAVAALPQQLRAVLLLSAVEGFEQAEVAWQLGVPADRIDALLAEAHDRVWLFWRRRHSTSETSQAT